MKRYILSILILILTLGLTAACVPLTPTPSAAESASPTPAPSPMAETAFPVTVTDDLGRTVTIAQRPQRLISLAPSLTEVLFAIGAGDQIVGVTEYCDYPEEAKTRERIGGFSANTISVEKIVALKPDLVLAAGGFQMPVIDALEELNIPVVALDPQNMEQVYSSIAVAGRLTGHIREAGQVVAEMQRRVQAVVDRVANIPPEKRPKVYWQIWDEPLMTAGPSAFAGQLIELAGGVNIFGDLTESYPQISAEEVVKRNPDVIMGPDTHGDKLTVEVFRQRPGWADITAVREGRIYLMDGNIVSRTGPRLVDALEAVAKALYPDLFE